MPTPRCPSPRTSLHAALALTAALAAGAAAADPVPGQGTWEATLSSRDINGDGTVDAWYDSVRNVTWLADARAIRGTSFDDGANTTDGRVTYASAASWLAGLDVYGVTGWRFAGADLIALYGTTLGNSSIPMSPTTGWTNTGPFLNVPDFGVSGWYWRGDTPADLDGTGPLDTRILAADGLGAPFYIVAVDAHYGAWAVVSGDVPVAAIPEPQTWALMLAGLAGLGWRARDRARSSRALSAARHVA
jgi:PEP-CTERM motif